MKSFRSISNGHRVRGWLRLVCLACIALSIASPLGAEESFAPEALEHFEQRIRPVLIEHCYACHSQGESEPKGSLRLDSRSGLMTGGDSGPAVVPGQPDESLLLRALRYEEMQMPPSGKLPDNVIADFERWIRDGAADPRSDQPPASSTAADSQKAGLDFWSFQPPQRTSLPPVRDAAWPQGAIDYFVLNKLEEAGLQPSPPADRRILIRRAYLDLIGLPPTPQQVDQFLADDSPLAFARVVDQLLASPYYGQRWGRHWLDVARYAEDQAHTFKARNYPQGYLYRDWVVQALNEDMPYDLFLQRQIAADLLDDPQAHRHLPALGLFALGPVYYAENIEKARAIADQWDDRIDTLTRGVLGLTVACARCHDHKFDPITVGDYYGLAGIFASSEYQERPIVPQATVMQRRAADQAVDRQQQEIDRFLIQQARLLRPALVDDIPAYVQAAAQAIRRTARRKNADATDGDNEDADRRKKRIARIAAQYKLSATLLERWIDYLTSPHTDEADALWRSQWRELLPSLTSNEEPADDRTAALNNQISGLAAALQTRVQDLMPRREQLLARYGSSVAFVPPEDRAQLVPGIIPLGNLFDDQAELPLDTALESDRFKAIATKDSLGIDRVRHGWGTETEIAPDIRFNTRLLGSDTRKHGEVTNDAWSDEGGLSTRGERAAADLGRAEQGIGMHANALVTFDLDEIRRAGLIDVNQSLVLRVDRAGLNDDVLGDGSASAHVAVIVSKPRKNDATFDAILAVYVNGQPMPFDIDDFTYFLDAPPPPPLRADGKFVELQIAIPPEAKYLTLIATGAAENDSDNSINNDHIVLSGARLEFDPLPSAPSPTEVAASAVAGQPPVESVAYSEAILLSRMFYDEGLLALPPEDAADRLPADAAAGLAEQRDELQQLRAQAEAIAVPMAHALVDLPGRDVPIYRQGNPEKPGELAPRALPAALTGGVTRPFEPEGSGRLALAQSLTSRDNPLTARVMANRLWAGHFGFGLVRTPSNFGQLGQRPSHPELLDWLALRLMDRNWSLKSLHREIMLSATYQQAVRTDAHAETIDPENRLLWRMNRRRLEVEPWRDSLLSVTGELQPSLGGPSEELSSPTNRRRTLYGFISRHRLDELLRLFDFPDPNITADRRVVTTVPLQQLFVLNSDFMLARATALAARLHDAYPGSDEGRIVAAHQLLYARPPTAEELQRGLEFLEQSSERQDESQLTAWQQYALALLSTNEFLYCD